METVGKYLKRERELRNISLREISTATKIREILLKAIEEDRHDLLPIPVFVKGFLIAYGKYIGLDPSDVVLRYESDLKELRGYGETEPPALQKKTWNKGFLLGVGIAVIGIGIILFNLRREPEDWEEGSPARVEQTLTVQEETPSPPVAPEEETDSPVEETISIIEVPPTEPQLVERASEPEELARRELTLEIKAIEETWIALQVDSDRPREITLRPGETFSERANDHIKLKIGNARGVNVTFNGKPLGSLGDTGRIVRLSLTHKGYEFQKREDFKLSGHEDEKKPAETP